jgi:phosphoenolpyruvate carboxylase
VRKITAEHSNAVMRLEEIHSNYHHLIAAVATGETPATVLDEVRREIPRLMVIAQEPYQEAINLITARMTAISEGLSRIVSTEGAIETEKRFREHFNRVLTTRSRTVADWEFLQNEAAHYHRDDVRELDRILRDFETNGFHHLPDSPTVLEFAAGRGIVPYNMDVTYENMATPKEY